MGRRTDALKKRFAASSAGKWLDAFAAEHPAAWQFILFNIVSLAATAMDLLSFTLLNGVILTPLRTTAVTWWLLDYDAAAGGLCALIATSAAYLLAQTVNFFAQRRLTFHAGNSVGASGAAYFVMIALIWLLQVWLSAVLLRFYVPILGEGAGGIAMRLTNGVVSLLIQFPMNKFVIMRRRK